MNFNPRTPCGVRHDRFLAFDRRRARFQSTHPVRGATLVFRCSASRRGISIHAPRAGCDYDVLRGHSRAGCISIHAPRAGCDIEPNFFSFIPLNFNPRTPCGVRHGINALMQVTELISIHAPRAGCDLYVNRAPICARYFNPRTPCGVRRERCDYTIVGDRDHFNPRTPCGVRLQVAAEEFKLT